MIWRKVKLKNIVFLVLFTSCHFFSHILLYLLNLSVNKIIYFRTTNPSYYPHTKSPSLNSTISLSSSTSASSSNFFLCNRAARNNQSFRSPLSTATPVEININTWRKQKYLDESQQRSSEIRELEQEALDRSTARHNRMIYSEEYRRLRLQMEGLILEKPEPKKDDFPGKKGLKIFLIWFKFFDIDFL